jgi:transposase
MTHDYKRHGTTTLFAALDVLEGTVIGQCMQRHRNQEFIRFLNAIERRVPAGKLIRVILDNYAAHKHPNVRKSPARHPRWIFHFAPTSCSWLNAVEGFFARLTRRRLKRGAFPSLVSLQQAINRFIEHHNQEPMPFTWKADPKDIIAAAKRGHQNVRDNPLGAVAPGAGRATKPGWMFQISGLRSSMGQTFTPSLRNAKSALVSVLVEPERLIPTRKLVDASDEKSIEWC